MCSYRHRFDALYSRAKLVVFEEKIRMLEALRAIEKPYQHTITLIEVEQYFLNIEAEHYLTTLQSVIVQCEENHLKRLECEVRLIQVYFHVLARHAGVVGHHLEAESSLRRIATLCWTYPDTAGQYLDAFRNVRDFVYGRQPHGKLYAASTRDLWWSWPKHKIGHLEHCAHGHLYSSKTWVGCSECGHEVVVRKTVKSKDQTVCLRETEFLAAMHDDHPTIKTWRR